MAQKIGAKGGKGGKVWDDEAHDNVTKISVRGGFEGIQYVQFEYVKSGQTKIGSLRGSSGRGFSLQPFVIDPKNEHLVSVEGSYDEATGVIQALMFKTNLKTSEMMGYDDKGTKFSLEVKGKRIIGFHGSADTNLNSLGAYFIRAPPTKLGRQGGSGGNQWDDGSNYNGVRKVSFTLGGGENTQIRQIRFDYDKGGLVETKRYGIDQGRHEEFLVDYPNEYIISVEGTCGDTGTNPIHDRVMSLSFKTSKGNTSPIFGNVGSGRKFVLESNGSALVGFHGQAGYSLDALGAYFSFPSPPPTKLDLQGGSGGNYWDDGSNYDGVRKVTFTLGGGENTQIRQIKFDYDKYGLVETRGHGMDQGQHDEFVVDYPNEYITSVEGTCGDIGTNPIHDRVMSLAFKTSKGRTSKIFGNVGGRKFLLESNGRALVGFHGRAGYSLDSLGAYFASSPSPPPAEKLKAEGGEGGDLWDDGVFDGVRKIYVGQGVSGVVAIKFVYGKDSGMDENKEHGKETRLGYEEPFELDYPSEYITEVEGAYDKILGSEGGVITMVKFKTNKKISRPFGMESSKSTFFLGKEAYKIVGFHGSASHELHQLGVHVVPITQ